MKNTKFALFYNFSALFSILFAIFAFFVCPKCCNKAYCENFAQNLETAKLAIVIDDFGGYERGGVEEMLALPVPLTCAVMPFVDNTHEDAQRAKNAGHEVILHMPMESHVNLPESWYGPVYIRNGDSGLVACEKIDKCLADVGDTAGVNIHIGSGVSRNQQLMTDIISHLKEKGKFFCDSRTIVNTHCEEACVAANVPYLGRDVFLEPHGMGGYNNACRFLIQAAEIAREKGFAVAIGHVGREGGINTARAIADNLESIKKMGVKIVPLSEIYNDLVNKMSV